MKKVIGILTVAVVLSQVQAFADIYNTALTSGSAAGSYSFSNQNFMPANAPAYTRFYDFDLTNITANFKPLSEREEKNLSGTIKEIYKKTKKIQKYISENNYEKAIKEDNDFLPTHIQYYNYSLNKDNYRSAMNEIISIKRINSMDKILNDDIISYKLGMLYYLNNNYQGALTYLTRYENTHNPSEENLWFALSDIYFNLNNYEQSINYAKRIPSTSINYTPSLEILLNDYYNLKNIEEAAKCAKELVRRNPNAHNYIRLAATDNSDDNQKLQMLNHARTLSLDNQDYTNLMRADAGIARIEQKKIDAAVANLSGFVEKPDWEKISAQVSAITEPIELSKRQQNFFQAANNCIQKYSNQDLVKCFEYVNKEEASITNNRLNEYRKEYEAKMQEEELLLRQREFLERTYYNRLYMDEFFYMRQPYQYFYRNMW